MLHIKTDIKAVVLQEQHFEYQNTLVPNSPVYCRINDAGAGGCLVKSERRSENTNHSEHILQRGLNQLIILIFDTVQGQLESFVFQCLFI